MYYSVLEGVLDVNEINRIDALISSSGYVDGRATSIVAQKHNLQLPLDAAEAIEAGDIVLQALQRHRSFQRTVQPLAFHPPLFARYQAGMRYPDHLDVALMAGLRTDVAVTVFLAEPEDYDGGELVVDTGIGAQSFKLRAGDAIAYPATTVHRVAEVTGGVRVVAALWVQSRVREAEKRGLLAELALAAASLDETASGPRLRRSYWNLLRMWAEAYPAAKGAWFEV